jgi:hypothetical protein
MRINKVDDEQSMITLGELEQVIRLVDSALTGEQETQTDSLIMALEVLSMASARTGSANETPYENEDKQEDLTEKVVNEDTTAEVAEDDIPF